MAELSTYQQQLKSPKWQRKRLEILNRDEWACKFCGGKEETLHVHHKSYEKGKKAWEYEDDNYLSLCEHCHDILEFTKKGGWNIINCKIFYNKLGEKTHLISASDYLENGHQFCLFWEFKEGGEVNGKELIMVLPYFIINQINSFTQENSLPKNG